MGAAPSPGTSRSRGRPAATPLPGRRGGLGRLHPGRGPAPPSEDRASWYLLAAGVAAFVCGDALENFYGLGAGRWAPPDGANACYLAGYLFVIVAVIRLAGVSTIRAAAKTTPTRPSSPSGRWPSRGTS